MFRLSFLAILLFASTPALADSAVRNNDYRVIAPSDWVLVAPHRGSNERRFVSPDGDAWLSLYATPVREFIATHLDEWRSNPDDQITYQKEGRDWIVVSGYKANRIFYRKTILACGGRKWHNLEFEYPASAKRAMDQFVTRASYALAAYEKIGCAS